MPADLKNPQEGDFKIVLQANALNLPSQEWEARVEQFRSGRWNFRIEVAGPSRVDVIARADGWIDQQKAVQEQVASAIQRMHDTREELAR